MPSFTAATEDSVFDRALGVGGDYCGRSWISVAIGEGMNEIRIQNLYDTEQLLR